MMTTRLTVRGVDAENFDFNWPTGLKSRKSLISRKLSPKVHFSPWHKYYQDSYKTTSAIVRYMLWTVSILHQLAVTLRSPPAAPLTDRSKQKPDCFAVEFKYLHNLNISNLNPRQLLARCSLIELNCTRRRRAKLKSDLRVEIANPKVKWKLIKSDLSNYIKFPVGKVPTSDDAQRCISQFPKPKSSPTDQVSSPWVFIRFLDVLFA